jgi:molybdenum cofactor cytidylyltransferase
MPHENKTSVFTITLAAGSSTRFGNSKQLLEFGGTTLVRRAMQLAEDCCGSRSLLVAGHAWNDVVEASMPMAGFVTINDDRNNGIGSSIAAGMRVTQHAADAVVVLLADQPLITPEHIATLIRAWTGSENEIVATAYAGTVGVPALFASGCFESLLKLEGDHGARSLLSDSRFTVQEVAFKDAAIDIDTADDFAKLVNSVRS